MGPKSLLLSFLGVGAITGTVIGGYCVLSPDKSNTTSEKQNNEKAVQGTTVSTQESDPAQAERALAPSSPAKPNNVESTARGVDSQTVNPARPELGSAGTRDSNTRTQGPSGPSVVDGTAA